MAGAVFEADAVEGFERFRFVGHAVEVLGKHDVFDGGEIRDQVEVLKYETNGFGADMIEFGGAEAGDVLLVKPDLAAGRAVEASDEIDQGTLAGPGRTHHRDPLAGRDRQRDAVERLNEVETAAIFFR